MLDNLVNISFADEQWQVYWPASDKETLRIILDDWAQISPRVFSELKNTRTVIQAGGHCGLYAMLYAKNFERVFTFEPELVNFQHLAINCNDTRVVRFNAALGDKNEFASLGMVSYVNTGMHRVLPLHSGGIVCYCLTIDSINPQDVDLIHLDVEGFEYKALRGAIKTIQKCKPLIVLEMADDLDKIYALMKKLGYKEIEKFSSKSKNSIFKFEE